MNGATKHEDTSNGLHQNGANGLNGGADRPEKVMGMEEDSFVSEQIGGEELGPKRIIICCDGTWQDSETLGSASTVCATNVVRLSNVLARAGKDRAGTVWPQVLYYQSGVGTGQEDLASKMFQGGLGVGLLENVIRAYNFIVNNYNEGDKLYIFGFSRGAYTARALSGLVCGVGILRPTAMPEFRRQYFNYISGRNFRTTFQNTMAWVNFRNIEPDCVACEDVEIEVVGVWDTVGALGIPDLGHFWRLDLSLLRKAFQFYDTELHENIRNAYHALALDECRESFKPTLWVKKNPRTNLMQCWFPGAHVNVGGGMQFEADETLAYVSYAWMLDRIRPHLALNDDVLERQMTDMYFAAELRTKYRLQSQGFIKDGLAYAKAFVFGPNALPVLEGIDPVAAPIDRMTDWMFNFMTWNTPRTPNQYHKLEAGEETCEYIHPSAICRYLYSIEHGRLTYIPAALRHWSRVLEEQRPNGDWVEVRDVAKRRGNRRARWYKYKMDLLGNPIRNGKNEFIVENYIDERPQPTNAIADIKHRPITGSIEGWLFEKSWSRLYYGKVATITLRPGILAMLPTGLHDLLIPEIQRIVAATIPLAIIQGLPSQLITEAPRSKGATKVLDSHGLIEHLHGNEGAKNKKLGKKATKTHPEDILGTATPVAAA